MWSEFPAPVLNRLRQSGDSTFLNGLYGDKVASRPLPTGDWSDCMRSLDRIRTLEDDWDGQGALSIPAETVASAQVLATFLQSKGMAAPNCVIQGVRENVSFEWELGNGESIEIDVTEPGAADVYFLHLSDGRTEHWTLKQHVTA